MKKALLLFIFIATCTIGYAQFDDRFSKKEVNYTSSIMELPTSINKLKVAYAQVKNLKWAKDADGEDYIQFQSNFQELIKPEDSSSGEEADNLIIYVTNVKEYDAAFNQGRLSSMDMFKYNSDNPTHVEAELQLSSYRLMSMIGKNKEAKGVNITIKKSDIKGDEIQVLVFKGKKSDLQEELSIQFSSKFELDYKPIPLQVKMIDDKIVFTNIETQKVEWANNYLDGTHIKLQVPIDEKISFTDPWDVDVYILFVSNIMMLKLRFKKVCSVMSLKSQKIKLQECMQNYLCMIIN